MKIALIGFDTEGRATYDYFAAQGHELMICDQKPELLGLPAGAAAVLGEGYLDNLDRFDLVVRTAGLPPKLILEKNPGIQDKITTHINEFFKACPTKNIIGVTGTKGKGTTSTLITRMLEAAGRHVQLGGNIGVPPLTFLPELTADSWVVLELSSFQLIDCRYSPHIAVSLMIVPEHLNWHTDMNEYVQAKGQLFAHQADEDIAIYYAESDHAKYIASASSGRKIPYFAPPGALVRDGQIVIGDQQICPVTDLKLLGQHNWQNVCAALTAVWQITQDTDAIRSVLTSFSGLPHRLEFVREVAGVSYYDDSFGTTPETAAVAIQAFNEPKVVILGGRSKGVPFTQLAAVVASSNVKKVIVIGEATAEIISCLDKAGYTAYVSGKTSMPEIVQQAQQLAEPGDVVLLSTGCASFDLFKDYKDRGDQFKTAVQALA